MLKEGQVLRWVRAWGCNISDDPLYVLVTKSGGHPVCGASKYRHICGGGNFGTPDQWGGLCHLTDNAGAKSELVPMDEWPDEVCREIALRAMGIEGAE